MRHEQSTMVGPVLKTLIVALLVLSMGSACGDGLGRFPPPQSCTPSCVNRMCGPDGCNHSCGTCAGDLFCEPVSGLCLGDGDYSVTGSIDVEYMYGNVQSGSVVISGPLETPGLDILVTVVDADGNVLGANFVEGSDGSFSIPVSRAPNGTEKVVMSTLWAPDGEVVMAVMDPLTADRDSGQGTFDPFVWYVDVPAGGSVGNVTVSIEDNSGALFIFLMNKLSFDYIVQPLVDKNYDGVPVRLAVFYGPWDDTFVPCTCYHGEEVTWVGTRAGPKLNAKISVLDEFGNSSAWGWSVLFHEFGHYILDSYSKDNSTGGYHYIGQTLAPKFAFSEGWATFMSLVTATLWFDQTWPVYWDVQDLSWFYVDFLAGRYVSYLYGVSEMVYPSVTKSTNQDLDENWVARTLYMIWEGSESGASAEASMTLDEMTDTVSSLMFLRGLDWARDADLNNFLDSAICLYPEKNDALTDRVLHEFGFPYLGNPECADYASMTPDLTRATPGVAESPVRPVPDGRALARPSRTPRSPIPPVNLYGVTITSAVRLMSDGAGRTNQ